MGSKNKYHVVISEESARMLISHSRFLAQKSETAAMRLISEFEHKAKSLELFPERNPLLAYTVLPPGKYRKILFADRYPLMLLSTADKTTFGSYNLFEMKDRFRYH